MDGVDFKPSDVGFKFWGYRSSIVSTEQHFYAGRKVAAAAVEDDNDNGTMVTFRVSKHRHRHTDRHTHRGGE